MCEEAPPDSSISDNDTGETMTIPLISTRIQLLVLSASISDTDYVKLEGQGRGVVPPTDITDKIEGTQQAQALILFLIPSVAHN